MTIRLNRRQTLGALGFLALPACITSDKKMDADVLILGAGLSGLHAARLLAGEGKDVLVLEGSDRIGGRLHTLDHGELGYTEGGGEQIGASYARLLDTARQLNVPLTPDSSTPRDTSYFYKDKLYSPDDWKTLKTHPFAAPFKGGSPSSPLFRLAAEKNPFTSAEDWQNPKFKPYDISAEDFLIAEGLGDDARHVIGIALNGNSLNSYSMMNLYRSLQLYNQSRSMGASMSVKGGAQRLPEAMADSLPRRIKMNQMITSITSEAENVTVKTKAGMTYRASHCICTLPFGVLRNIHLSVSLNTSQNYAIKHLPYTQIYQIHFQTETPFWEQDGLPADMWTDSPLERIFVSRDASGQPTALCRAWINGGRATQWAMKDKVEEIFFRELKKIRPATGGKAKILATQNWTKTNPLSGGAYMHFAPKQIPLMTPDMAMPAGNLLFAGEHLGYLHTGMEAAMEAGENAVFSLLDA